ncbi:MAG TPA: aspartate ammonia-lyase [Bacteroidota bacterium]|nr:aspartate ammonia-lyase [Bacteroidota bacterium]
MSAVRREHDLLGERDVPAERYYGIHTLRALENYNITGIQISHYPLFIQFLVLIKKAAAFANRDLGLLEPQLADAIAHACDEIYNGALMEEFVVDVIQGGAGTSTNMNANEVIANRALELLGYEKGRYDILHPLIHVNLSQSTNDVYPTALRMTLSKKMDRLREELEGVRDALFEKGKEFSHIIKMGRTQLQDAVPMTLGQEFEAWAVTVNEDVQRITESQSLLREINLGATAIGTGLNAHPDYARIVTNYLREMSSVPVVLSENLVEATQDTGVYVQLSGVLKRVAVKLSKICNDLRLLSSGPRAGLHEINLPPMAAGSSIMPGKINPIIPEVVNQVAFCVIGNDTTVTMAAEAGQLELNVMEPIIAYSLFTSSEILSRACRTLTERCIRGITANADVCRKMVENSIGLATALNPYIGYEKATEVAHIALTTNRSVYDVVLEKGYLSKEELDAILSPEQMIKPHVFYKPKRI